MYFVSDEANNEWDGQYGKALWAKPGAYSYSLSKLISIDAQDAGVPKVLRPTFSSVGSFISSDPFSPSFSMSSEFGVAKKQRSSSN